MTKHRVRSEDLTPYKVETDTEKENAIIAHALEILTRRVSKGDVFSSPSAVSEFLIVRAAQYEHREAFGVLFLDAQNRLIEAKTLFEGTLSQCAVYVREIVAHALRVGAASIILTHNHPSGTLSPSAADEAITKAIAKALELVDIRLLDHIITAGGSSLSMAEKGLM